MSEYAGRNRRRNLLSEPRAQLRIIAFFAVMTAAYAVVNIYVSKHAFLDLARDVLALELSGKTAHDVQATVAKHETTLNLQLAIFTGLGLCMVCLATLLLSHRIGGPIHNLTRYLDQMTKAQAEPREVHFRHGDFFADLATKFNEFQKHTGFLKTPRETPSKPPPAV